MNSIWWKIIGTFISLVAIAMPVYIAYDIYQRDSIVVHKLEVEKLFRSSPTLALSGLEGKFELTADSEIITNLQIMFFYLQNSGERPIIPNDFHENISVSVGENWKIIGVSNEGSSPEGIELTWQKTDDRKYEAKPVLINPKDGFITAVYIVGISESNKTEGWPAVRWDTRIENLQNITLREYDPIQFEVVGIVVLLSGWALPFTVISSMLVFGTILFLSFKADILPNLSGSGVFIIVIYSILAISASEVAAYYIFEPLNLGDRGGGAWIGESLNWSIVFIQSILFIYLLYKVIKKYNA